MAEFPLVSQVLALGPELQTDAWALGSAELELVLGEVAAGRTRVVECGSGLSTIAIARLLRELGAGSVHALEHDPEWVALGRKRIAAEGLGELATIVAAPLAGDPLAPPGCRWYERRALAALPGEIDLLLVDGPPAEPGGPAERSRYPALPLVADRLEEGAVVVLDDGARDGERWVLERWLDEFQIQFERRRGCALGTFNA